MNRIQPKIAVVIPVYKKLSEHSKSEKALMEQMYLMINLFRFYNIIPIFVFDGKPPEEKRELINQRKEMRKEAKINYELLKEQYDIAETEDELAGMLIIASSFREVSFSQDVKKSEIEVIDRKNIFWNFMFIFLC